METKKKLVTEYRYYDHAGGALLSTGSSPVEARERLVRILQIRDRIDTDTARMLAAEKMAQAICEMKTYPAEDTTVPTPEWLNGDAVDPTLPEMQDELPWGLNDYSQQFNADIAPHRDYRHAAMHLAKAAGILLVTPEDMDHDPAPATAVARRAEDTKRLVDIIVVALRMANTHPSGRIELLPAIRERLSAKKKDEDEQKLSRPEPQSPPEETNSAPEFENRVERVVGGIDQINEVMARRNQQGYRLLSVQPTENQWMLVWEKINP